MITDIIYFVMHSDTHHLGCSLPYLIILGTSAASQGPRDMARAWAMPSLGVFLAHSGAKWISWHILPPLYILTVLPSSSGSSSSIGLLGYVAGISNCNLNSYLIRLCMHEHVPDHEVASLLFALILNQSLSFSLFIFTYAMIAFIYSANRYFHFSSFGPAWIVRRGILWAAYSIELCILCWFL